MDKAAYALLGVVIGSVTSGIMTLVITILNNKTKLKMERIKLHDNDCLESHKKLLVFAERIRKGCFPVVAEKREVFEGIMKTSYENDIEMNRVYFSPEVNKILNKFSDIYVCMTHPDLSDFSEDEYYDFLDNEVYDNANELCKWVMQNTVFD